MNAADYRTKKRPATAGVPMKLGNLFGGDKTQETITTTYSDSFNRTNTQTDVKENLGNTSLTVGGGAGDSLPLLIGGGLIVAAFLALR
jgi:hypothetical protein